MDMGVVLDLMIHDIDLVLSLVGSPLATVDALGVSVLGGHEDVANARLEFESRLRGQALGLAGDLRGGPADAGLVAAGLARIDFAARTTTLVRPSETLLGGEFHADGFTPEQVEYYKTHLAEEHLPREQQTFRRRRCPGAGAGGFRRSDPLRRGSRGSAARRAATPWPWPSRSSIASTPIVGTPRWTVGPAPWRSQLATSYSPGTSARRPSPRRSSTTRRAKKSASFRRGEHRTSLPRMSRWRPPCPATTAICSREMAGGRGLRAEGGGGINPVGGHPSSTPPAIPREKR